MNYLSNLFANLSPAVFAGHVLVVFLIFIATKITAGIVRKLVIRYVSDPNTPLFQSSIITNCTTGLVYFVGVLIVMDYFHLSITPFITALGIGGMALAIGLQDTMNNIFSGFHLIITKQIRVGDHIALSGGYEGVVTDITLRYTTLVTALGSEVTLPNATMAKSTIVNHDRPKAEIAVQVRVGVDYTSDLAQVEAVTVDVAEKTMAQLNIAPARPPVVRYGELGESAIIFNVVIFISDIPQGAVLRHEFIKNLIARYRRENITVPFPVRQIVNR